MGLVNITTKEEFKKRRMKSTGDIFEAKKLGTAFYILKSAKSGCEYRCLAKVVEELSEEVTDGNSTGN